MIDAQGWFTWGGHQSGLPFKVWPGTNKIEGVVFHSAVGSLSGVVNVVNDPNQMRSVTGAIGYDGRFIQFYPVTACVWANGTKEANLAYPAFEFEGGYPGNEREPLTPDQTSTAVRILQDLAAYKGVSESYWRRPTTLIEHREIVATACPSGRIGWDEIVAGLHGDDETKRLLADREGRVVLDHLLTRHFNTRLSTDKMHLLIYDPVSGVVASSIPVPSLP